MPTSDAVLMDHTHGVIQNRCAHPDCVAAYAAWSKRYALDKHRGIDRTADADRVRLHVASLEGAGWSRRSIAAQAGVSPSALSRIVAGQRTVRRDVQDRLLALSAQSLADTPHRTSGDLFVPRVGTVRRIQALLALGWTHAHLSGHSGTTTAVLLTQQGRWVTRTTHDAVARTYAELGRSSGPSAITRRRAERRGYHSPLAWDDVDIDAEPDLAEQLAEAGEVDHAVVHRVLLGEDLPTTTAERFEVVARMRAVGRPLADLERLGWRPDRYRRDTEQEAS